MNNSSPQILPHNRKKNFFQAIVQLALPVLFFLLYALTATSEVQGGDAGEFASIAYAGGLTHPPGYPIFMMIGRFANFAIPFATPAFKLALVSAFFAALALTLLFSAIRLVTGSKLAAFLPVLSLGLSSTFWRYATVGEVFALTAFNAALIVLLSLRIFLSWRGKKAMFALGLSCALGIAHQYTVALLFPLIIVALWKNYLSAKSRKKAMQELLIFIITVTSGFLPYLFLLNANGILTWGQIHNLSQLSAHFFRLDYGVFQLAAGVQSVSNFGHLLHFFLHELNDLFVVVVLLLLFGTRILFKTAKPQPDQGLLVWPVTAVAGTASMGTKNGTIKLQLWVLALLLSFLLSGPGLLLLFNVPVLGLGLVVAERFYLLPEIVLTMLAFLGAAAILPLVKKYKIAPVLLIFFVILASPFARGTRPGHLGWTVLQDYIVNALDVAAPGAVIIGSSDSELGGYLYVQKILKQRNDVLYIAPPMLGKAWYRAKILRERPKLAGVFAPSANTTRKEILLKLIRQQLQIGPVYLALDHWSNSALRTNFTVVPVGGVLLQVLAKNTVPPKLNSLEHNMRTAFEHMRIKSWPKSRQELTETWEGDIFLNYARSWNVLADLYRSKGDKAAEQRCRLRALRFAQPWKM